MAFDIQRAEVDGVRTFWTNGEGPATAILSFRVGVADEAAPQRGITHLVEHLALAPLGLPQYDLNGTVEPLRTLFAVQGSIDEVVDFMASVSASLSDLRTDRLLVERAVLRREASEQPISLGSIIRGFRFGPVGPGMVSVEELGVEWLGPDLVRTWARERFSRGNAVLVINRQPPPGLKLALADGPQRATPAVENPAWLPLPTHLPWPQVGVAMTYTLPRGPSATTANAIFHRRARNALRFEDGAVYDIAADYEPIDPVQAHVSFGTDTDEAKLEGVTRRLLEVHDRLIAEGPTTEELKAELVGVERQFEHPDGRFGYLDFLAVDTLLGRDPVYPDELLERRRSVTAVEVQASLSEAGERMLVATGQVNPAPDRLQPYPSWSPKPVNGETFSPAGFRLPGFGRKERLIVGGDGLSMRLDADHVVTVRFDELVAAIHLTDRRVLIGRDGFRIDVHRSEWRDGQRIIDAIDRTVPSELIACEEHAPGAMANPPQDT